MKIERKFKEKQFLTFDDLKVGDIFCWVIYCDASVIYMKVAIGNLMNVNSTCLDIGMGRCMAKEDVARDQKVIKLNGNLTVSESEE